MRVEDHKSAINKLELLIENNRRTVEQAQRALACHERRLEAHRAELEQHETETWVNARILELDRQGVGAAGIIEVLRAERGYVLTYMGVYLRARKLRSARVELRGV
jgi:hypothetical protein